VADFSSLEIFRLITEQHVLARPNLLGPVTNLVVVVD